MFIELSLLVKLTSLSLSDNPLLNLPRALGNLTSLEELWLHNTKITSIPAEIKNLCYPRVPSFAVDSRKLSILAGREFQALIEER